MKKRDLFQETSEKVIFNIIAFILYEFIKKDKANEYYELVVEQFRDLKIDNYEEKHKYLLSV